MNQKANYPEYPNNQPQAKKNSPWLTCGIVSIILLCGILVLVFSWGGMSTFFSGDPEGLQVKYQIPSEIKVGDNFTVEVTLTNTGRNNISVDEIQLPNKILDGAVLKQAQPNFSGTSRNGDQTVYQYGFVIGPGESKKVTFQYKAIMAGDYSGSAEIVVGPRRKIDNISLVLSNDQAVASAQVVKTLIPSPSPVSQGAIPYKAVVQILAMIDRNGQEVEAWWGSGTIVTPDGLILTNAHVVNSTKEFKVKRLIVGMTVAQDQPSQKKYVAEIMQLDPNLDLAVIRIKTDLDGNAVDKSSLNLPFVPTGDSDGLRLGDQLVIIGYPKIGGESITLTRGEVAGFTAEEPYGNRAFVKTSATITGGNSGGLAANSQGQIVGVPTQLGYGGNDQYVDCRPIVDTNGDGVIDEKDSCVPTGGFINALRPIKLAMAFIEKAKAGDKSIVESVVSSQDFKSTGGKVILKDDFSDPKSGWPVYNDDSGSAAYHNGEYFFTVTPLQKIVWINGGNKDLTDSETTIDARVVKTIQNGGYGLMCRLNKNKEFYGFEVTEDGYFSIWKRIKTSYVFLQYWQKSDLINGDSSMKMTVSCIGDQLSLAVNGKILAQVTDSSLTTGDHGMFVETYEKGDFTVAFDNYVVQKP